MSDDIVRITIDDGDGEDAPKLRSNLDAERAALRDRDAAWRELAAARSDQAGAHIEAVQARSQAAQMLWTDAMERGDFASAAEAQRKMVAAEQEAARLADAASVFRARAQAPADPVEAYIAGRSEPTARWLREHPEWITDRRKNEKLTAAHFDAVGEGLRPDSDDYFSHIERYIGIQGGGTRRIPARINNMSNVNRADPNTHVSGNEVLLTAGERTTATDGTICWNHGPQKGQPIGIQEFARRKREMIRQGYYSRLD